MTVNYRRVSVPKEFLELKPGWYKTRDAGEKTGYAPKYCYSVFTAMALEKKKESIWNNKTKKFNEFYVWYWPGYIAYLGGI